MVNPGGRLSLHYKKLYNLAAQRAAAPLIPPKVDETETLQGFQISHNSTYT
jgi:hypothetical protein